VTAIEKEDQLRRLVYEIQLMRGSAEVLQQRLELLQSAVADLRMAESSLKGLKELDAGTPILVPMGGGSFVNARLGELSKVIVGIGADVSIEMDFDGAIDDVSSRLTEAEGAGQSVQQQLEQILGQIQVHQDVISRLGAELRGEAAGV